MDEQLRSVRLCTAHVEHDTTSAIACGAEPFVVDTDFVQSLMDVVGDTDLSRTAPVAEIRRIDPDEVLKQRDNFGFGIGVQFHAAIVAYGGRWGIWDISAPGGSIRGHRPGGGIGRRASLRC